MAAVAAHIAWHMARGIGYEAFVKLYRENSDIKSEYNVYNVCVPNMTLQ